MAILLCLSLSLDLCSSFYFYVGSGSCSVFAPKLKRLCSFGADSEDAHELKMMLEYQFYAV